MRESAKGVQEAAHFLESGCEPLRTALNIQGLLLPIVSSAQVAATVNHGSGPIDIGNEIIWDDSDALDKKLSAAAFMKHMSILKVGLAAAECPSSGTSCLECICSHQANVITFNDMP